MNKMLAGLSIVGLLSGCVSDSDPPLKVMTGKIDYNRGVIYSEEFYHCSGVILDFGDDALMAHSLPKPVLEEYGYVFDLHVNNVVERLTEEAGSRGLEISEATAYVNGGSREYLDIVCSDLAEKNIPIADSNIDLSEDFMGVSLPRSVWFDPAQDSMLVFLKVYR